jgi:glutamate-1-semialdehyde 2,1-aminomutase
MGNAGCILPEPGFLEFLREITLKHNALLIFDEVMTGFRVALGGAQEKFNVMPDITTLGKVIGGGLPVGAYGASREIMSLVAPSGPMYQAGTLSGNPLAMTAGLTCLRKIQAPGFYNELEKKTQYLIEGMNRAARDGSIALQTSYCGGMFGFFFSDQPVRNYADTKHVNADKFRKFYLAMLDSGVYFAPSAFEAGFMSAAHSYEDLDQVVASVSQVLTKLS